MFKQTEEYYKNQMLGFGSGSIYDYGCYLVSLVNGLVDFGWDFTPRTFNEFLKEKELWIGPYKNYIDVNNLPNKLPNIFTSFKRIDGWPGFNTVNWYLSRDYIVLGKVSAKGIGGSGSHFVRVVGTNNSTMTIIDDPWFGTRDKVTKHYGQYGNILGLRVFGVKNYQESMPNELEECLTQHKQLVDETVELKEKLESKKKRSESLEKEAQKQKEAVEDYRRRLSSIKSELKKTRENFDNFIYETANITGIKSPGIVPGEEDIPKIVATMENHRDQIDYLQKKVKEIENQKNQLEKKKEIEIMDLKESLKELKDVNERQAKHIKTLEQRLDRLESDQPQLTFLQKLINFLKGVKNEIQK